VQTLLTKRIQKEKPKSADWSNFLDLFVFTFLVNRDAPLYVIHEAAIELKPYLNNILTSLQNIRTYLDDLRAPEVDPDTGALSRASTFLQAYSAAVLDGGVTQRERESLQRFETYSSAFMDEIKDAAGTSLSASEAVTAILAEKAAIESDEAYLVARSDIIETALQDYNALNLQGRGVSIIAARGARALDKIHERFGGGTANIRDDLELISSVSSTVSYLSTPVSLAETALTGTGDAAGTGTPAEIATTISGPFDITPTTDTLRVIVDGTTWDISIDNSTQAVVTSVEEVAGGRFEIYDNGGGGGPPPWYIRVSIDGAAPVNYPIAEAIGSPIGTVHYCTSATVVADLAAAVGFTAVDNGTNFSLTRDAYGEDRNITIVIEDPDFTLGTVNIGAYLFLGYLPFVAPPGAVGKPDTSIEQKGTWTSSYTVEENIETQSPAEVKTSSTSLGKGNYGEVVTGDLVMITVDGRSNDIVITNGSTSISSPSVNFENLGAAVGDRVKYSIPPHGAPQTAYDTITAISGSTITVSTAVALASSILGRITVYPDPSSISVGDILSVSGPVEGRFTITTATEDVLAVDTTIPGAYIGVSFSLTHETLTIYSNTSGTDSTLEIGAVANNAAPTLGIAGLTDVGEVSEFSSSGDFVLSRLREGDTLDVGTTHSITSVADNISVSPYIPNSVVGASFSVINPDYTEYATFVTYLSPWLVTNRDNSEDLDRALNIVINSVPPQAAINGVKSTIDLMVVQYQALIDYIDAYDCREIDSLKDLIKLLSSSGMDRARDRFRMADLSTFFEMEEADTTYYGHFAKVARQTIAEYGNLDRYKDLVKIELENFVFPEDLLDVD